MTQSSVSIQITPESAPSIPSWFAEVAAFAQVLTQAGILKVVQEQVRFARARFGQYDLIDFVVVLIGYAVSSEPTRDPLFMNGFCRSPNPLWRSLAATSCRIAQPFPAFLRPSIKQVWRPSEPCFKRIWWPGARLLPPAGCSTGGESPGSSSMWTGPDKPPASGHCPVFRLCPLLIVGSSRSVPQPSLRRKRGEVARTRTVIVQAHTHQLMGTFGGPGNGDYRGELVRAIQVITSYARHSCASPGSGAASSGWARCATPLH